MDQLKHWTADSTEQFVYRISSDFVGQLEMKLEKDKISRNRLAKTLRVTKGRVSQVLNDPGNLTVKLAVEYAHAAGMKAALIAYDDHDPENFAGPINAAVFTTCWDMAGRPKDLFSVAGFYSLPLQHVLPIWLADDVTVYSFNIGPSTIVHGDLIEEWSDKHTDLKEGNELIVYQPITTTTGLEGYDAKQNQTPN